MRPPTEPPSPSSGAFVAPALATARVAPSALWTGPFLRLLGVQCTFGLAFSTFFLLPKFLSERGASAAQIGVVMSLWGIAGVVTSPIVGSLLDRVGRRPFVVLGTAMMVVASLGFVWVEGYGALALALRLLQGIAFAMVLNAVMTLVADRAPPARMGQAVGLAGVAGLLTNAVAPVIVERVAAGPGWAWGFAGSGVVAAVAFVLACRLREPARPAGQARSAGWKPLLRRPVIRGVAWASVTCGVGFGAMATFHQPYALQLGIREVGSFFVAYTGAAALVRIGLGGVIDRLGSGRMALVSLVLYAAVVAATSELGLVGLALAGGGLGIAHGTFFPAVAAFAMERAGPGERGRTMSLLHTAFNGGLGLSVVGLGFVAQRFGYPPVYLLAGALVASGAGALWAGSRRTGPSSARHDVAASG